jgi:hypothetical protein
MQLLDRTPRQLSAASRPVEIGWLKGSFDE